MPVPFTQYVFSSGLPDITKEQFIKKYQDACPILVTIRGPGGGKVSNGYQTQDLGSSGPAGEYKDVGLIVYEVIAKDHEGNPQPLFPLINVGRTKANHIFLRNPAVSKNHATFSEDLETKMKMIKDERSLHGTALITYQDQKTYDEDLSTETIYQIPSGEKVKLEDGIVIEFGGTSHGTRCLYLQSPERKYEFFLDKSGLRNRAEELKKVEAAKQKGGFLGSFFKRKK